MSWLDPTHFRCDYKTVHVLIQLGYLTFGPKKPHNYLKRIVTFIYFTEIEIEFQMN